MEINKLQKYTAFSDNDLIIATRNGDNSAFSALVQRHDKEVFTLIARYFQSSDEAKDVYQDIFIKVYYNLKKFEFQSEYTTWLYRITVNTCLTHKRLNKNYQKISIFNTDEEFDDMSPAVDRKNEPDNQMVINEQNAKVLNAVNSLSPKQKMVVMLKHLNNYKIKEIARIMNCTEGTIKKYLFIAVGKLKTELKNV